MRVLSCRMHLNYGVVGMKYEIPCRTPRLYGVHSQYARRTYYSVVISSMHTEYRVHILYICVYIISWGRWYAWIWRWIHMYVLSAVATWLASTPYAHEINKNRDFKKQQSIMVHFHDCIGCNMQEAMGRQRQVHYSAWTSAVLTVWHLEDERWRPVCPDGISEILLRRQSAECYLILSNKHACSNLFGKYMWSPV